MKTITLGELAATDKREWVQHTIEYMCRKGKTLSTQIPVVPDLHRQILTRIENGGDLDMRDFHGEDGNECGTTHCYAGWTIFLGGSLAKRLQHSQGAGIGTWLIHQASFVIIAASCPHVRTEPNFNACCPNRTALATIRRYAAMEGK